MIVGMRRASLFVLTTSLLLDSGCTSSPSDDEVGSASETETSATDSTSTSESTSESTTDSSDSTDSTDSSSDSTDTTDSTTDSTDTGPSACAGECGTPNCGDCPEVVDVDIAGGFSITSTEVSHAAYAQFLAVDFDPGFFAAWLPAECEWKNDFTPTDWVPNSPEDLPVVEVDWCDAWAYCAWSGQQLCGKIGGGNIPKADIDNPALDQWHKACTGGGNTIYPYGVGYDPAACNGLDAGFEQLVGVGALASCEGGYPGLFDLSGNVWEWENSCLVDPMKPAQDHNCQQRGGSYFSDDQALRCAVDSTRTRNFRADHLGIRCCDMP